MTNNVKIIEGVPGVGKTKYIEQHFRNNLDKKKFYFVLSHEQLDEREGFLKDVKVTHWRGMPRICPQKFEEPVRTMLKIGAPTRWICQLCQELKLVSLKKCWYKKQFKKPANIVIAPASYLFTKYPGEYNPDMVVVDDIILDKHDLPHLTSMKNYIWTLFKLGICDYETLEELFDKQGKRLKRYILRTIEPKLKATIQRSLKEGSSLSKESAEILLKIDPVELLEWYRLVKKYGWQEYFSLPMLMKVFELSLEKGREVIVVGAKVNKLFVKMLVKNFQKEYGYPINPIYEKMKLNQPVAKSIIYRVKSATHPNAWYPHIRSIAKNKVERATIKERIETILLSLVDNQPSKLKHLNVGFIKPKKTEVEDFLTSWTCHVRHDHLNFGNLRGSNLLEYCDVLIIIGTYVVNVEDLRKDFERFYHRKPWSTQSEKLTSGGYRYVGDPDLENFRKMLENYEMYQAIHRIRPALKEKKVYVFGLVPEEFFPNFPIKYIMIEKDSKGGMRLVEWKSFEQFVKEQIGDKGIYQRNLVNAVYDEFGGNKEVIRRKIRKFVAKRNGEYMIVWKEVNGKGGLHVQLR